MPGLFWDKLRAPSMKHRRRGLFRHGKIAGTVALGEYGEAGWSAEQHAYRSGWRRA